MFINSVHPNEPCLSLPTSRLVTSIALAAALTGSTWVGVAVILRQSSGAQMAGLLAAAVVAIVAIGGILAIGPWKTRPVGTWMSLWLAGMVIRMLATPAITFLLYFAVPVNAAALALAMALVYLVVVITEAMVVARHVGKVTPATPGAPAVLTSATGESQPDR